MAKNSDTRSGIRLQPSSHASSPRQDTPGGIDSRDSGRPQLDSLSPQDLRSVGLLNAIHAPVYIKTISSEWTFVNDAFCSLFNIKRDDLDGRRGYPFLEEGIAEVFESNDRETFDCGISTRYVEQVRDFRGNWRSIIVDRTLVQLAGSNEKVLVGSMRDETEKFATEAALQEHRRRFEDISKTSSEVLWELDSDLCCIFVSEQITEVLGLNAHELVGRAFCDALNFGAPNDFERIELREYLFSRLPVQGKTFVVADSEGTERWLRIAAFPLFNEFGIFSGYRGTISDLSEQRQFAELVRLAQERAKLAVNGAELGVWEWCLHSGDIQINERAKELINFPSKPRDRFDEILGQALHPDDALAIARQFSEVMAGNVASASGDVRVQQQGEGWRWIRATINTVARDRLGRPIRVAGTFLDIDGSKRLEEEVRRSIVDVEKAQLQIQNQTRALKKRAMELRDARDKAEAILRQREELLVFVSREMRTPLTAILARSEFLLESSLNPEQNESVHTLVDNSHALHALVIELSDLSKIEAERQEIRKAPFSLRQLLRSLEQSCNSIFEQRQLTFVCTIDETAPVTLVGDEVRIRQLLVILVNTALKLLARHGIRLCVQTYTASVSKGNPASDEINIEFLVADSDLGGIESARESFAPYSQLNSYHFGVDGGVGLGLSICARLVELLNGRFEVRSDGALGTALRAMVSFRVLSEQRSIPQIVEGHVEGAREPEETATLRGADVLAGELVQWHSEHPLKILVADDIKVNQRIIKKILEGLGHSVVVVGDGQAALKTFGELSFDIVMLDIDMPVLNGLDTLAEMRKTGIGSAMPILAFTASSMESEKIKFGEAGMDGHIDKPVNRIALMKIMREVVSARSSAKV